MLQLDVAVASAVAAVPQLLHTVVVLVTAVVIGGVVVSVWHFVNNFDHNAFSLRSEKDGRRLRGGLWMRVNGGWIL